MMLRKQERRRQAALAVISMASLSSMTSCAAPGSSDSRAIPVGTPSPVVVQTFDPINPLFEEPARPFGQEKKIEKDGRNCGDLPPDAVKTSERANPGGTLLEWPSSAPDGSIAGIRQLSSGKSEIVLSKPDGSEKILGTVPQGAFARGEWDGNSLVYVLNSPKDVSSGSSQVWLRELSAPEAKRIDELSPGDRVVGAPILGGSHVYWSASRGGDVKDLLQSYDVKDGKLTKSDLEERPVAVIDGLVVLSQGESATLVARGVGQLDLKTLPAAFRALSRAKSWGVATDKGQVISYVDGRLRFARSLDEPSIQIPGPLDQADYSITFKDGIAAFSNAAPEGASLVLNVNTGVRMRIVNVPSVVAARGRVSLSGKGMGPSGLGSASSQAWAGILTCNP